MDFTYFITTHVKGRERPAESNARNRKSNKAAHVICSSPLEVNQLRNNYVDHLKAPLILPCVINSKHIVFVTTFNIFKKKFQESTTAQIFTMSSGLNRRTEEPQRADDARADAEWKSNPGLGDLLHGNDQQVIPRWIARLRQHHSQMETLKTIPQVVMEVEDSKAGLVTGKEHRIPKMGCRKISKHNKLDDGLSDMGFLLCNYCGIAI
ncbi:hypothetical protein VTL71DRAFT_12747 [Oculimacula yallundae]|uniref:Uncharacterized protein n=1 Tax=Oculimacula yallundae TaxID=86028 RepID=A0ABR4CND7_9HELO